ncbi:MAG: hydantoinase B/oxoprolinase family protein [Deltaproteobacteria bacterium]|nr:hydantoinase B/oxoprolinase family protein [Deltaproteobacteria bacterium]
MHPDFDTLLNWFKVEPPTADEMDGSKLLEAGDLEIYGEKLNQFISEAYVILQRIGIGMMIRSGDSAIGLYTKQGDLITCSTGVVVHALWPQLVMKWMICNYMDNPDSNVDVKEGDIFYANEPLYGAIHGPDQSAYIPIFNEGELVGWAMAASHTPEAGAVTPGGMPLAAKNRFYEGMKLPPIKIGENYTVRDDMLELISNYMSRASREAINDLKARVAASTRLTERVSHFAKEKGNLFVNGLFRGLVSLGEVASRKRIEGFNDGTYRVVTFIDHVGMNEGLLRCSISAKKKGDTITFDFTGSSPEHDQGSYLSFPHHTVGITAIFIMERILYDLPLGVPFYSFTKWNIPKGTIFNADPMAPTCRGPSLNAIVMNAAYQLFAKMMFDSELRPQICAATGCGSSMNISGTNQYGVRISDMLSFPFNTEGMGARVDMDGVDSNSFIFSPTSRAYDAEETEAEMPIMHLYQKHRKDSCGFGKFRGGSGTESAYVVHHVPKVAMFSGGRETHIRSVQGLFGGYPGAVKLGVEIHDTNIWEKMKNKDKDIPANIFELLEDRSIQGSYEIGHNTREYHQVKNGDIIIHMNAGGAGYGDPLFRDPNSVMEELKNDIISDWTAKNIYKVIYDPETCTFDAKATEEERQKEREERKKRAETYDEFEKRWLKKRPADEALTAFGSWPEGKQTREIIRM